MLRLHISARKPTVILSEGRAEIYSAAFFSVPSMALNLAVKVRYGGTYQPTISEAQAIRREARSGESV